MIVTGGAGFIGSNFINYWLKRHKDDSIVNIDMLTYASNPDFINKEQYGDRYTLIRTDICDRELIMQHAKGVDTIINFAAESHVDNSINNPEQFLHSNYMGVFSLLEAVKKYDIRYHQISTDEVYGSLPLNSATKFDENTKYNPRNPYSATKAAADFLVNSYINTYGIRATISNCSNNYGPHQHEEKLIPKTIRHALSGENIPVYGRGNQIRDWIYVEDHCSAVESIIEKGRIGETYLVSSRNELENLQVVKSILSYMNKSEDMIQFVKDRPGHDEHYAIDPSKIERETGWKPKHDFEEGLKKTIEYYLGEK